MMAQRLAGKRVAILAADGVERVELDHPRNTLTELGARVDVLSPNHIEIKAVQSDLTPDGTIGVDGGVGDAEVADYDLLILPGGTVNPDKLRADDDAVSFVAGFVHVGKPVASIGHGAWTLVEAGLVDGRRVACHPCIRTDLVNAGATVVDQDVVNDRGLITSRSTDDLPAFVREIVSELSQELAGLNHCLG